MRAKSAASALRLPRAWKAQIRSAVLHVLSLAHAAIAEARGRVGETGTAARLRIENDRLRQEIALLREEIRIKDARMSQLAPQRRPHYPATERMAILELRAARGWSLAQTARAFLVTSLTIATWMRRLDDEGPHGLVILREPVNKFPDFVGYLVRRLKTLCPSLGKAKIADTLARAGLHVATTTVGRMLKEQHLPKLSPRADVAETSAKPRRIVTAKRPNHVWHVDLTTVPIGSGFWTSWLPFALPQHWPFCWWLAVVVDHYSRRAMGVSTFTAQPKSADVCAFLGRTIGDVGSAPKYVICDKGPQFWCAGFKRWCKHRGIKPRFGAVGKHRSIAIAERFIRTLKESLARLPLVPTNRAAFRRELAQFFGWYDESRPHSTLAGRTPNEVYFRRYPANRRPRHEPRARWPRGSPCAGAWALVRSKRGARLELDVAFVAGHRHLPVVRLCHAA